MKPIIKQYAYEDVLLIPQYSEIVPREVMINTTLTKNIKMLIPIAASPMDTVCEWEMALKMAQLGGLGFIHKNMPYRDQIEQIKKVKAGKVTPTTTLGLDKKPFAGVSISHAITESDLKSLIDAGVDAVVLDSAHGHSKNIINKAKKIKKLFPKVELIVGNIATTPAAKALVEIGVDAIRVGIGPGAICTTRIITGIGVPQLSAVINCAKATWGTKTRLIADGGIRHSGDMVKALAAGADLVMIGSMAAGTEEAPGQKIYINDKSYKAYRGMGSIGAMKRGSADRYGQDGIKDPEKLVPEGVEGLVQFKGSIENTIFQCVGGIRSGLGYIGAKNLKELHEKAEFIEISSAGVNESHPHSLSSFEKTNNYKGHYSNND